MNKEVILKISNLTVAFKTFAGSTNAVENISVLLNRGETLGIVGESGSGKSTTALAIMKLIPDPPGKIEQGQIRFIAGDEDVDIVHYPGEKMQSLRGARIAMIFQDPMAALNPVFRCGYQVMETILQHQEVFKSAARQMTIDLLREVRLPDPEEMFDRYPHEFFGGQQQRICIARALVVGPTLLICDEAVSALDASVQAQVLNLLIHLKREMHLTYHKATNSLVMSCHSFL